MYLQLSAKPISFAKKLSDEQCQKLYQHQIELAQKNTFPLSSALITNKKYLQTQGTIQKQIIYCQNNINIAVYHCQMQAKNFYTLLACERKQKDMVNLSENNVKRMLWLPKQDFKISMKNCQKSYETILKIVNDSQNFQKRKDQLQLRKFWQTREAKQTYQKRCIKRFTSQDLKCIQDADKFDALSTCLIAIPE